MDDQRFDEQLAGFLRWQAAQTAGAPGAADVALRLPASNTRTPTRAWRMAFALGVTVAAIVLAGLALALVGSRHESPLLTTVDGPLAAYGGNCDLVAVEPVTGETSVIADPVDGCPTRGGSGGAFAAIDYRDVGGSADGRYIAYARMLFCGGCSSIPTTKALAAQGAYLFDAFTGVTERLDDCLGERCWFRVAISPDGRYVAYTQDPYQTSGTLGPTPVTVVDREAGTRTTWVGRYVTGLVWAHRSDALAIVQSGDCDPAVADGCSSSRDEVVIASPDGASRRSVATLGNGTTLSWTTDDRSLVTVSEGPFTGVPAGITATRIDLTTGETAPLFSVIADSGTPRWSPDGTHLAYRRSDGSGERGEVHIFDATGMDVMPPGMNDLVLGPPVWSPSGTSVLFDGSAIPTLDGPSIADSYTLRLSDGRMSSAMATAGTVAWLPAWP